MVFRMVSLIKKISKKLFLLSLGTKSHESFVVLVELLGEFVRLKLYSKTNLFL